MRGRETQCFIVYKRIRNSLPLYHAGSRILYTAQRDEIMSEYWNCCIDFIHEVELACLFCDELAPWYLEPQWVHTYPRKSWMFSIIRYIIVDRFYDWKIVEFGIVHEENFMAIFTTLSVVIWFSTGILGIFATLVYVFTMCVVIYDILSMAIITPPSTSILFCNLYYILLWISPRSVVKIAIRI